MYKSRGFVQLRLEYQYIQFLGSFSNLRVFVWFFLIFSWSEVCKDCVNSVDKSRGFVQLRLKYQYIPFLGSFSNLWVFVWFCLIFSWSEVCKDCVNSVDKSRGLVQLRLKIQCFVKDYFRICDIFFFFVIVLADRKFVKTADKSRG